MFRFPVEIHLANANNPTRIGLMHPELSDHPFVKHIEKLIECTIEREPLVNRHGYSNAYNAIWWHAVDLISAGEWRGLLETAQFTDARQIMNAIVYGCRYSHHSRNSPHGYISTGDARQIMREIGSSEPNARNRQIHQFNAPRASKQENGAEHWPINSPGSICSEEMAWSFIHGIEDGLFEYDRAGFLQWSALGRLRFEQGECFTDTAGQFSLAL